MAQYDQDSEEAERIAQRWKDSIESMANWRIETKDSYGFVAGDQWLKEDADILEEEDRPVVTFNRCDVFIDSVTGFEINNRQDITFLPREEGDVGLNEILTETAKWIRQECNAQDEESEAARDAAICGIGCVRTRMDYQNDPDGMPVQERIDPLNVWWDSAAKRKCLTDRRFQFWGEWMDKAEAEKRWPDEYFSGDPLLDPKTTDASTNWLYKDEEKEIDGHKNQVFVLMYEEYQLEDRYRVLDPNDGRIVTVDKKGLSKIKKVLPDVTSIKQEHKVYYRAFCDANGRTLEYDKSPCQHGFTFNFITFKRDRNRNSWYGLVRVMKDPQRWANKWMSQILHIINTNAKGGAFVETGALVDPKKASEQWSQSSPLIQLKEGGIGKIKDRVPAQYPNGLDKLMMFAFESLPFVNGINLEALGLADRQQAGVIEASRKASAFTILAPFFDSLRRFRKAQGRILLYYIQNFVPNGKLVRVIGKNGGAQYIPLVKDPTIAEYDVIVDQSPDSPDFKAKTWEGLMQILPAMMKNGYPIPPDLLKYAPLPSELSQEWITYINNQPKGPDPQVQQAMQQAAQQMQQLRDENQKLVFANQQLQVDAQVELLKLQQRAEDSQQKAAVKVYQTSVEAHNARMQQILEGVNTQVDQRLQAVQLATEHHNSTMDRVLETQRLMLEDERAKREELARQKAEEAAAEPPEPPEPPAPRKKRISLVRSNGEIIGADVEELS